MQNQLGAGRGKDLGNLYFIAYSIWDRVSCQSFVLSNKKSVENEMPGSFAGHFFRYRNNGESYRIDTYLTEIHRITRKNLFTYPQSYPRICFVSPRLLEDDRLYKAICPFDLSRSPP
jgi:hypothetical protein